MRRPRYYIWTGNLGILRAVGVLSTVRGWRFTMAMHDRRLFASKSEAKRALRWAMDNGYRFAAIRTEEA